MAKSSGSAQPAAVPPVMRTNATPQQLAREAMWAWLLVLALVAGLVHLNITLPAIGHLGSALIAVTFLYVPTWFAWRRGKDLVDYGFVAEPVRRGLATAALVMLVLFPIFIAVYIGFYQAACKSSTLMHLAPRGLCARYGGLAGIHWPVLHWGFGARNSFAEFCIVQLVVVALPEELFFRGYLLALLEKRWPPTRRILGGGVGIALVLSAAAFAMIHLPKDGDPRALATFFPGLLFGWMRSATGSILASTVTHASSNILIRLLEASVLR
ncbi:MAG: CPBP family intramembrane metalloprotease [Kofleriaceae bacterium]|nr:CPBP family intramembrane metalloprotease [Kofleriaceae bacterium]